MLHLFSHVKIRIFRVFARSLPSKKYSKKTRPVAQVLARDFRILRPRREMRPILLFSKPLTRAYARRSRRLVLGWRQLFGRCVESVSGEPTAVCFCVLYFCCIGGADLHKNHGTFAGPRRRRFIAIICAIVCNSASDWHLIHRSHRRPVLVALIRSQRMLTMLQ